MEIVYSGAQATFCETRAAAAAAGGGLAGGFFLRPVLPLMDHSASSTGEGGRPPAHNGSSSTERRLHAIVAARLEASVVQSPSGVSVLRARPIFCEYSAFVPPNTRPKRTQTREQMSFLLTSASYLLNCLRVVLSVFSLLVVISQVQAYIEQVRGCDGMMMGRRGGTRGRDLVAACCTSRIWHWRAG